MQPFSVCSLCLLDEYCTILSDIFRIDNRQHHAFLGSFSKGLYTTFLTKNLGTFSFAWSLDGLSIFLVCGPCLHDRNTILSDIFAIDNRQHLISLIELMAFHWLSYNCILFSVSSLRLHYQNNTIIPDIFHIDNGQYRALLGSFSKGLYTKLLTKSLGSFSFWLVIRRSQQFLACG